MSYVPSQAVTQVFGWADMDIPFGIYLLYGQKCLPGRGEYELISTVLLMHKCL